MGCDEDKRPVTEASSPHKEKVERENLYETEPRAFFAACTRARDRLLVNGHRPRSDFPEDPGAEVRAGKCGSVVVAESKS